MHSTLTVEMGARAELVFDLARDVERWPSLLPHYVSVRVVGSRSSERPAVYRMVARRTFSQLLGLGLPVTWQARAWSEPANLRLRFVHVAGATKGMDVTWQIVAVEGGCRVSIEHDFRPRLPVLAVVVDRWFTRPIASHTLATFKALAEALTDAPPAIGESDDSPTTNPPT